MNKEHPSDELFRRVVFNVPKLHEAVIAKFGAPFRYLASGAVR